MKTTVSLAELLHPAAISTQLTATRRDDILAELCALLETAGLINDSEALLAAVLEREKLGSTGCGSGVAVPHARMAGIEKTLVAIGLSKPGVNFGGVDDEPVKIYFLLVGPQKDPETYLKTLSQIAKLIKEGEFRDDLLSCSTPADVLDLIKNQTA